MLCLHRVTKLWQLQTPAVSHSELGINLFANGTGLTHRGQQGIPAAYTPAEVWQAPSVVSRLVAGGTSCCRCGAFVSSLSEHVSPEQPGGVPLVESHWPEGPSIELQPVVCSGSNSAARVGRRISVLTRGSRGGAVLPSMPMV